MSQALGADLAGVMQLSLENSGFFQSELLAPLIVVIHLAGLDRSFAEGFKQVNFHQVRRRVQFATLHTYTPACQTGRKSHFQRKVQLLSVAGTMRT